MTEEIKKKNGLAVREYMMTMHMNAAHAHIYSYSGFLDYPGHELDGKRIYKSVVSPKKGRKDFDKPVVVWWIDDGTEKPPEFHGIILLMNHYKLPIVER